MPARPTKSSSTNKSTSSTTRGRSQNNNTGEQQSSSTSTMPSTPTSSSTSSKISMSSSFLPYQYRREVRIPSSIREPLPPSRVLEATYRPIRVGLGSAVGNLRTSHVINSKKDSLVTNNSSKKISFVRGSSKCKSNHPSSKSFKMTPGGDPGSSITSRMKMLTIYESPKSSRDFSSNLNGIGGDTGKSTSCRINPTDSVCGKVFLTLNKKANYLAALNRKATYSLGGRPGQNDALVILPTTNMRQNNEEEESNRAISNLCRHFRNILGWKLSIHLNWKYAEEKIKSWYSYGTEGSNNKRMSVEEVAELLKITGDKLRSFEFDPDMEHCFNMLRKNLCHTTCPNIAKLVALQKIQKGQTEDAARVLAEHCGMYVHSEIVDKHLAFIRRSEEMNKLLGEGKVDEGDKPKAEIFWEQVRETLKFSDASEKEFPKFSSFNHDWNVVQLSTSVQCTNRFGYDLIGKRKVPQLILSVFGFLPGKTAIRSEFTTFCSEPLLQGGSLMRNGLIEAFEKLIDNNLTISDDKVIISRKKYWEERGKHNDAVEAIMYAMEDWLFPWTFLLAGTIKDKAIQKRIATEVLSHQTLKKCSNTQKYVIYRLTEGYNILPIRSRNIVDSLVAFILQLDEDVVQSLTKKIFDVGSCISPVEPRNPTILVLDQDIDILPWDWLPCLRTTDVTRMPSLNLIRSTQLLTQLIGGGRTGNSRPINGEKCTFVLNPDGSLPQVQARLEKYFSDRDKWVPVIGRSPTTLEMQHSLENQDIFLYCGHGAGSNFYPEYAVQKLVCRAIPILMGCSSAQSHFSGPGLYSYSSVHAYFTAGCSSVVGFLWEVTDTECDRITADFIERWLPHPSAKLPKMPLFDSESMREHDPNLSSAWKKSRTAATQLLTQCAAVCYGIPIVNIN